MCYLSLSNITRFRLLLGAHEADCVSMHSATHSTDQYLNCGRRVQNSLNAERKVS